MAEVIRPTNPDSVHALFEAFVNEGDLDNVAGLYEAEAALIDRDGKVLAGAAAIREYLRGLLSINPSISIRRRSTIDAGDIAVLISEWQLAGTAPDGSPIEDGGRTYDVIRRQADGTWKVVVENPWSAPLDEQP